MSDGGRDLAKGAILTLAPTGLGFILSGWIIGVVCLFVAGGLSLILWTPLGQWLGFHSNPSEKSTEPSSNLKAQMAEFFREGDGLREECITAPDGPPDEKLRWAIAGGTPEEQCEREEKARDWDARVSTFLWSDPNGKALAPGWKAIGDPPGKALEHPKQSMMNPARLAEWYRGKLDYLAAALKEQTQAQLPSTPSPRRDAVFMAAETEIAPAFNHASAADKAFQSIQEMFDEAKRRKHRLIEAELVAMIDEGEGLRGDEFSGNPTLAEFGAWRGPIVDFVGAVFGATEKQRLLEVKWNGYEIRDHIAAVLDWLRALRDRPDSWRVPIGGEEVEAAIRARRSPPLAEALDSLMREGIGLVEELSVSVEAEETSKGAWKLSGGDAPTEWQDKANAFRQSSRDLLTSQSPALLTNFRDGFNGHFQKESEAEERRKQDPAPDRRSTPEKMLDMANHERSGPRREVEACLEGLAQARKSI